MTWRIGTVLAARAQTARARTLELIIPGWPGHAAGQHVDVRLTAADGYSAVRSYSIAAPVDGERIEITVEALEDGEVSPYLVHQVTLGNQIELRGPIGGWFVWRPTQTEAIQLVAGGSGVVPLVAIARGRAAAHSSTPMRLLYSVRDPTSVLHRAELNDLTATGQPARLEATFAYTRSAPAGWPGRVGRVDAETVASVCWPPSDGPTCYVCGPTAFVEHAAGLLVRAGHDPARIRTERFGGTGGATG